MPIGPTKTKKQKRAVMKTEMHKFKSGKLHSGSKSGPVVKGRKQAIAIGLSESGQSSKGKKRPRRNPAASMSTADFEKKHGNDRIDI